MIYLLILISKLKLPSISLTTVKVNRLWVKWKNQMLRLMRKFYGFVFFWYLTIKFEVFCWFAIFKSLQCFKSSSNVWHSIQKEPRTSWTLLWTFGLIYLPLILTNLSPLSDVKLTSIVKYNNKLTDIFRSWLVLGLLGME